MEKNTSEAMMSDGDIVELFFAREERALTETDRKYGRYLMSIAMNVLNSREDSEECLNDTYLQTWISVPPTRPSSLKAFLARIMRGRAINKYDERRSQKRIPQEICEPLHELWEAVELAESMDHDEAASLIGGIVSEYLEALPDRSLYIFVARYFYARGLTNIAERLGVSLSTVNKELAKMKKELRVRLEKGGIVI